MRRRISLKMFTNHIRSTSEKINLKFSTKTQSHLSYYMVKRLFWLSTFSWHILGEEARTLLEGVMSLQDTCRTTNTCAHVLTYLSFFYLFYIWVLHIFSCVQKIRYKFLYLTHPNLLEWQMCPTLLESSNVTSFMNINTFLLHSNN